VLLWFHTGRDRSVSIPWSIFRECCGQRTLSGVFKAGDFHHNTGWRLLIDVTSRGRPQQTTPNSQNNQKLLLFSVKMANFMDAVRENFHGK